MVAEGLRLRTVAPVRFTRTASYAILLVGLASLAAAAPSAAERDASFDYLHIEANSGSASGGHTAICFGDRCFHFQQAGDRTIRLHRESAPYFDHAYRALGNRTIHDYRVPVSAAARVGLLNTFEDLHQKQQRDFGRLDTLHEDRRFLDRLAGGQGRDASGKGPVRVPGSAYFLENEPSYPTPVSVEPGRAFVDGPVQSTTIERVARRVRERYGPRCLEARAATLGEAIRDLLGGPTSATPTAAAPGDGELPDSGLSARYRELLSAWLAVEVLHAAPPLRQASVTVAPARMALDQRDWGAIEQFRTQLEDSLVELYGSKRADWGYPMLVGLARVTALAEAVSRRELVLLDVFREDAEVVPAAEVTRYRHLLSEVLLERYADLAAAREAFVDDPSEMRWSRLEAAANLAGELEDALRHGEALRVHHNAPVPVKSATRGDWPRPRAAPATLARLVAVAHTRTQRVGDELAEAYAYDLFRRNCVTEILEILDSTGLTPDGVGTSTASDHAPVDWSASRLARPLRFIPFVSAYLVRSRLGASRLDRPSYRQLVLSRMEASENPLFVQLRESNVLTSTIYESNERDPLFLFFTDDSALWRPLEGLANLTVSTAAAAAGAMLLPVDAGTTLRRALTGFAASVPEIFFVSVRKGSFPFAPHRWLKEVGCSGDSRGEPGC